MRFVRSRDSNKPGHARPQSRRRRSYTPILVIMVIYTVAIGINEWRLHRHVESVRAAEQTSSLIELETAPALEPG